MSKNIYKYTIDAHYHLRDIVTNTPTVLNANLSDIYEANIFLKREDLQVVRSYKLRGAFNKMRLLEGEKNKTIYCASAGNHAQGVAYACATLNIKGKIYMPVTTPKQKIKKVKFYGKEWVDIILEGDTYDDAYKKGRLACDNENGTFIHPFDDEQVIAGQGTVALEIINSLSTNIDYIFVPIGGGGLISGIITVFKELSPNTKIIGVEPQGAASMIAAMKLGHVVELPSIDSFVDGAAVKKVGNITFEMVKNSVDDIITVSEGRICTSILNLYNEDAIVVEPAGALSVAALGKYKDKIKGKNVVCVISGGNNDIVRMEEIKERSLLFEGFKHYFIIQFPQRPGALKHFVVDILGPNDDISYFQYTKKNSRERGPAVVGIELKNPNDFDSLIERMNDYDLNFTYLNNKPDLFTHLIM